MEESFECMICLESHTEKYVLECNPNHIFCRKCMIEWYKTTLLECIQNGFSHRLFSCPMCRQFGGFRVLEKAGTKEKYRELLSNIGEKIIPTCVCRIDSLDNPYTSSKYCKKDVDVNSGGRVITICENMSYGLCKTHCEMYDSGTRLYHFFYGFIQKEDS